MPRRQTLRRRRRFGGGKKTAKQLKHAIGEIEKSYEAQLRKFFGMKKSKIHRNLERQLRELKEKEAQAKKDFDAAVKAEKDAREKGNAEQVKKAEKKKEKAEKTWLTTRNMLIAAVVAAATGTGVYNKKKLMSLFSTGKSQAAVANDINPELEKAAPSSDEKPPQDGFINSLLENIFSLI